MRQPACVRASRRTQLDREAVVVGRLEPGADNRLQRALQSAAPGGSPQEISVGRGAKWPTDWSRDGRFVVFSRTTRRAISASSRPRPAPPTAPDAVQRDVRKISPDGSWLAYLSDESGRRAVRAVVSKAGRKLRVSTNGGNKPVWRPDGRALFFITASGELVEAELLTVTAGLEVRAVCARFFIRRHSTHCPTARRTPLPRTDNVF